MPRRKAADQIEITLFRRKANKTEIVKAKTNEARGVCFGFCSCRHHQAPRPAPVAGRHRAN